MSIWRGGEGRELTLRLEVFSRGFWGRLCFCIGHGEEAGVRKAETSVAGNHLRHSAPSLRRAVYVLPAFQVPTSIPREDAMLLADRCGSVGGVSTGVCLLFVPCWGGQGREVPYTLDGGRLLLGP